MTTARTRPPARSGLFGRFRDVLGRSGAIGFAGPAALARLGFAMTGLGLLLTVQAATGSYAVAGIGTGAFAAAEAIAGPWTARLVDRWGQTTVVPIVVALHAAAIALVLLVAGSASTPLLLALIVVAGTTVPQPGALSAARWSALVDDQEVLRTAFSLEAVVNDVVFLCGPVLVTTLSTAVVPWAGSASAAAILVAGCAFLVGHVRTAPPARPRLDEPHGRILSAFVGRSFLGTLGVHLGLGCFFGAVPLIVTASASADGLRPLTGVVLASSSAASIAAGLTYGAVRRQPRPERVQFAAAVVLALAVGIGVLIPSLVGAAVMLAVGGLAIAPLVASSSQIVQTTVPADERTQGFVWINTASAVGIAGSAAAAGALIGGPGVHAALDVLFGLVLCSVCAAVVALRPTATEHGPASHSSD